LPHKSALVLLLGADSFYHSLLCMK